MQIHPFPLNHPATCQENEEFILDIMIESDVNVSGAEMELIYDPAIIEIVSIAEGNFFKQAERVQSFQKEVLIMILEQLQTSIQ